MHGSRCLLLPGVVEVVVREPEVVPDLLGRNVLVLVFIIKYKVGDRRQGQQTNRYRSGEVYVYTFTRKGHRGRGT